MQQPFCFSRSFAENSAARTCPRRRSCVKIQIKRRACARPWKKRKLVVIVLQTGLRRTDTDMTKGSVLGQLVAFSVPLLIGNIFQQLYNTVDSVVVGNFVGKEALAAVGSVGPVINMLIGFFNGFATGAGVVISRHYGARQRENVRTAVQTTIAMTILMSIVLSVLGVVLTPALLRMMQTPEEVLAHASEYLQIYFAGLSGLLLYNMGAGILRAVGDTRRPLYFLIFSAVTNTILDLLFVAVFHMGVAGVAIATILAQFASAALVLAVLTRTKGDYRIEWRAVRLEKNMLGSICALGLPSAVQLAVTAFSNIFVQSYINRFGADCMAGWTSYNKIDSFALLPITTISLAVTTFVGQNLGAGDHARAKKGTRDAVYSVHFPVLLSHLHQPDYLRFAARRGRFAQLHADHAGLVRTVPADLPDDRLPGLGDGPPGGDGLSGRLGAVQRDPAAVLPERRMEKGKRLQGKSRIKHKRPAGTLRRAVLSSTGAKGLRGEPRCSGKKAPLSGELSAAG